MAVKAAAETGEKSGPCNYRPVFRSRMSILTPFFKSPLTDLTGSVISSQWGDGPCRDMEMKALDCLDAYGIRRGEVKCAELIKNFDECSVKIKQMNRTTAMRLERHRQHFAGERSKEDKYSKNPPSPETY
ncbi:hypothetical protein YQE_04129, partial [Dendroctonus ponderosae]